MIDVILTEVRQIWLIYVQKDFNRCIYTHDKKIFLIAKDDSLWLFQSFKKKMWKISIILGTLKHGKTYDMQ